MLAAKPHQLLSLLALLLLATGPAAALERILEFRSDISVQADASLQITESITVSAEGRQIRRGIYRDIPTNYTDRRGNRVQVDLHVLNVSRDGVPEAYQIESLSNGLRIRIGDANRFLQPGNYNYRVTYHANRQLGFFDNFDELYWNVTGNGWSFPIETASAHVTLPAGANAVQMAAYTGPQGGSGKDFLQTSLDNSLIWTTTRVLQPREGLTIAVAWPKGFVSEPGFNDKLVWFLRDNAATGLALIGTALVFWYYMLAWRRYGKDPDGDVIFPRFEPPAGVSPAACRFIRLMNFDKRAFSAAVINMGVKGYLSIEEEDDSYRLHKETNAKLQGLSTGEQKIARTLLEKRTSILLDPDNRELLKKSVKKFRNGLESEYEKATFVRNTPLFAFGALLSSAVMVVSVILSNSAEQFMASLMTAACSAGMTFIVLHFWGDDTDPTFKAIPFRNMPVAGLMAGTIKAMVFVFMAGLSSIGAMFLQVAGSPMLSLCIGLLAGLNVVFFFLLKRPTLAGRKLMDEIEGFRMYLGAAEQERLQFMHPPEQTPQLFEKFLPYAMALDVENEWNEKFTSVLAAASTAGETSYRPRWYRGSSWQPGRGGSFGKSLGASLGTAVASSVSPPGSSSGSGGGGFSGGGGGGGGGGGW